MPRSGTILENPLPVQSIMMGIFGAIGGAMGVKARYPQYSDT